uniref:Myosin VIIA and Rab interacting protein b n=1 Tax=Lepisosteus oculatus TaxID=7918 RepID=W5N0S0_LEPOC
MRLRKKEKERLSEMKQELEEEGSKCTILSKQNKFNDHCCIRCCSPFTFLINTKRQCLDCKFNVCKSCRNYSKKEKAWICSACQKSRLLRTQSLEWYYNNVKSRFKRFGSAKVLKTLYRKHLAERGTLSDVTDGSIHEGSFENEGSICGSDSTFYRQSEGHSMAETLMVALRVAEEAIEEAISKAEEYSDSLEKQNEARYLRDNKEELIEELATTIVQKIIRRRRHSEVKTDFEYEWPRFQSGDMISPTTSENSNLTSQASPSVSYSLWVSKGIVAQRKISKRSQSAFSLTGEDTHEKPTDPDWKVAVSEAIWKQQDEFPTLKKVARPSPLPSWKSMDRLDNSSPSSMLQSPDGNWIALQSALLSRPSLLTKPKSEVFATLEKESGVISAYDELGSDTEDEEYGWNSTFDKLRRQHRKLSDETYYTDSQHDPEWTYTKHGPGPVTSPSSGQYTNTETMCSDSETSSVQSARNSLPRFRKTQLLKRNGLDHHDALDINLNPQSSFQGPVDSSEAEERHSNLRRSRRRRRSKLSLTEQYHESDTLLSTYPIESSRYCVNHLVLRLLQKNERNTQLIHSTHKTQYSPGLVSHIYIDTDLQYVQLLTHNDNAGSLGATVRDESCCPPQRDADVVEVELKAKLCEMACNASDKEPYSEEESDQTKFGAPLPESSPCVREDPALLENVRKNHKAQCSLYYVEKEPENLQPKLQFLSSMLKQIKLDLQLHVHREGIPGLENPLQVEIESSKHILRPLRFSTERKPHLLIKVSVPLYSECQVSTQRQDLQEQHHQRHIYILIEKHSNSSNMPDTTKLEFLSTKCDSHFSGEHAEANGKECGKSRNLENSTYESLQLKTSTTDTQRHKHFSEGPSLNLQFMTAYSLTVCTCISPFHFVSFDQKYSAATLCNITTEVLKVLNATEELIEEAAGDNDSLSELMGKTTIAAGTDTEKLDEHLTTLEENVYLAAGSVYGLEGQLGNLEECARSINSVTTENELAHLEDQVASAAAQVHQAELQISDIEQRISALKTAGLNVAPCTRFSKYKEHKQSTQPQTLSTSRRQRRKLPAPPVKVYFSQVFIFSFIKFFYYNLKWQESI